MEVVDEGGTCSVCLELYSNPHILTCGHKVCLSCTTAISATTPTGETPHHSDASNDLRCPVCKRVTLKSDLKPSISTCGICKLKAATTECQDCQRSAITLLCKECSEFIHKGVFGSHRTGPLHSFKSRISRCKKHQKKTTLLCEDDLALICVHCTKIQFDGHQGHKIVPAGVAVEKMRDSLPEKTDAVTSRKQKLQEAVQQINAKIGEDLQHKQGVEHNIHNTFEAIKTSLEGKLESVNKAVTNAFEFQESVGARNDLMNQVSKINDWLLTNTRIETLGEVELVDHICSYLKIDQTPVVHKPEVDNYQFKFYCSTKEILALIGKIRFESTPKSLITGNGQDGELTVNGRVELDPTHTYNYTNLTILQGGVLTVSSNLPLTIRVQGTVTIQQGGSINLVGKGHVGGTAGVSEREGLAMQGSTYKGQAEKKKEANRGGGGGGVGSSQFGSTGGGGGGYGTAGQSAIPNKYQNGNNIGGCGGWVYGDEIISTLYMGSGGGAGHQYNNGTGGAGGNGGGALRLVAQQLKNFGAIICDGANGGDNTGHGSGGGGGSGGSVILQVEVFENRGTVTAQGGYGGTNKAPTHQETWSSGGSGGMGRVRVDTLGDPAPIIGFIEPQPDHLSLL